MNAPGDTVSVAQILLDLRDEAASARAERRQVLDALRRSQIDELNRAFASLHKAEDFENQTARHYRQGLDQLEARQRWVFRLSAAGAALGALLGAFLLVWALTAFGPSSPGLCAALGGQHGVSERGNAFCAYWAR